MLAFLLSPEVQAQSYRFIYLQSENKQPFYVKMDKTVLNSSKSGYMIISKLVDREYNLVIGVEAKTAFEYAVTIKISEVNAGYLLKKSGENEWGLFNLLAMTPVAMQKQDPVIEVLEFVMTDNEFAKVLAQVVNDPSIAMRVVVKKVSVPVKLATPQNTVAETESRTIALKIEEPGAKISEPAISKIKQQKSKDGVLMTYVDKEIPVTDTVKMLLPVDDMKADSEKMQEKLIAQAIAKKDVQMQAEPGFIDMALKNPNQKIDSGKAIKDDMVITEKKSVLNRLPEVQSETKSRMINSDCKKTATQNDFVDLRKKMAAKDNEADMLKLANRQFLKSCFTCEQIKNLAVLFIKEEEKYKFFVAAFPHVTDTHNYSALEDQLSDNYYKTRFKAMLGR